MKHFTKEELFEFGYTQNDPIQSMLDEAQRQWDRGVKNERYILKLIIKRFGKPKPKTSLREKALTLREAIVASTEEEKENLAKVRRQMNDLLRVPVICDGSIMPDACPAGSAKASMPVGGVIVADGAVIPSAHSSDICCSMYASFYLSEESVSDQLDKLQSVTRFGSGGKPREEWLDHDVLHENVWLNPFLKGLRDKARMHLADQGDGNHFAFLGEMEMSNSKLGQLRKAGYVSMANVLQKAGKKVQVLVTHHGSRGLGAHVFKRGQLAAEKQTVKVANGIPDCAAWLDIKSTEGKNYWEALQYTERWTKANHQLIHERFLEAIRSEELYSFGNVHSFVWEREGKFYHGKGATPAWKSKDGCSLLGLIPLNMAEPILLVSGKDNEDYLSFAPHGAGRNLSRTTLMRKFRKGRRELDTQAIQQSIQNSTKEIDVRWFSGKPDITETPIAYKTAEDVRKQIEQFQLADIIAEIQPKGCIMAGASKSWKELREETLSPKQIRQIGHRAERRLMKQSLRDSINKEYE